MRGTINGLQIAPFSISSSLSLRVKFPIAKGQIWTSGNVPTKGPEEVTKELEAGTMKSLDL